MIVPQHFVCLWSISRVQKWVVIYNFFSFIVFKIFLLPFLLFKLKLKHFIIIFCYTPFWGEWEYLPRSSLHHSRSHTFLFWLWYCILISQWRTVRMTSQTFGFLFKWQLLWEAFLGPSPLKSFLTSLLSKYFWSHQSVVMYHSTDHWQNLLNLVSQFFTYFL